MNPGKYVHVLQSREETTNHILIHCYKAQVLWDFLLAVFSMQWVWSHILLRFDSEWAWGWPRKVAKEGVKDDSHFPVLEHLEKRGVFS